MGTRYDGMSKEELINEVMVLRAFIMAAAPRHWVDEYKWEAATEWEREAISVLHLESISKD